MNSVLWTDRETDGLRHTCTYINRRTVTQLLMSSFSKKSEQLVLGSK